MIAIIRCTILTGPQILLKANPTRKRGLQNVGSLFGFNANFFKYQEIKYRSLKDSAATPGRHCQKNASKNIQLKTRTCMYLHVRVFDVRSRQSLSRLTSQKGVGGVTHKTTLSIFLHKIVTNNYSTCTLMFEEKNCISRCL